MALETITTAPSFADFISLADHQSQTPGTFFGGKPVLHLHCPGAKLKAQKDQLASQAPIAALQPSDANGQQVNGSSEDEVSFGGLDVWVTSKYLALWSASPSQGVQIPYQSITITAQDGDAVLLELNFTDRNANDDDDIDFMQLRILPSEVTKHEEGAPAPAAAVAEGAMNGQVETSASHQLWQAIFDCQELNPDPVEDDENGEGETAFDETAPGPTGWITSENMHEFMDEEGNLKIPEGATVYGEDAEELGGAQEQLGESAGRVRNAEEAAIDEEADGEEAEDTKWRRTG